MTERRRAMRSAISWYRTSLGSDSAQQRSHSKLTEEKVMIRSAKNKYWLTSLSMLLLAGGFLFATQFISGAAQVRQTSDTPQVEAAAQAAGPEKYLFVWAGDPAR